MSKPRILVVDDEPQIQRFLRPALIAVDYDVIEASTVAEAKRLIATRAPDEVTVVGPAPCPIERIKNRWRWHILLKSAHPGELTRVSRYFMERFEIPNTAQLRVTLDRDPVALL